MYLIKMGLFNIFKKGKGIDSRRVNESITPVENSMSGLGTTFKTGIRDVNLEPSIPYPSNSLLKKHYNLNPNNEEIKDNTLDNIDKELIMLKDKIDNLKDRKVKLLDEKFEGKDKWTNLLKIVEYIQIMDKVQDLPYSTKYNMTVFEFNSIINKFQTKKVIQ